MGANAGRANPWVVEEPQPHAQGSVQRRGHNNHSTRPALTDLCRLRATARKRYEAEPGKGDDGTKDRGNGFAHVERRGGLSTEQSCNNDEGGGASYGISSRDGRRTTVIARVRSDETGSQVSIHEWLDPETNAVRRSYG